MKGKKEKKQRVYFSELYDIRDSLSGVAAWDYMDRYIKLKAKALQLEKRGFKVRMLLPDFPRRPLLVIGK
jgi:hypothetical protein